MVGGVGVVFGAHHDVPHTKRRIYTLQRNVPHIYAGKLFEMCV